MWTDFLLKMCSRIDRWNFALCNYCYYDYVRTLKEHEIRRNYQQVQKSGRKMKRKIPVGKFIASLKCFKDNTKEELHQNWANVIKYEARWYMYYWIPLDCFLCVAYMDVKFWIYLFSKCSLFAFSSYPQTKNLWRCVRFFFRHSSLWCLKPVFQLNTVL